MQRRNWGVLCAVVAASAAWAATVAHAEVVGGNVVGGTTLGAFEELAAAPATAGPDEFDSPNLIAFDEMQDVLLMSPLLVGLGNSIPAGAIVSSHYVAFDPALPSSVEGFVTFDEPILAIIGQTLALDATASLLGAASTTYSVAPAVGLELQNMDEVFVSPMNPNRLVFRAAGSSPGDQVRVITGIIPEPTSLAMLAVGLGVIACVRRGEGAVSR